MSFKIPEKVILPPFGPDKKFDDSPGNVFVFGSNLEGIHGGGAAAYALKSCGAVIGEGFGLQSGTGRNGTRSYALPTLDVEYYEAKNPKTGKVEEYYKFRKLTITELAFWVDRFKVWACSEFEQSYGNYETIFVTKVGCGLAGFEENQVARLFQQYPNMDWPAYVTLPTGWMGA